MATPAPAAPAATPAAAPKPATTASNTIPPQPIDKPIDFGDDIDAELGSMDEDNKGKVPAKPAAKPAPKPAAKVEPPKPKVDPEPEPEPDPDLEDEGGKTKEEIDTTKPVKAADLRTAYQSLKKKLQEEHLPKIAKLESRIKELESRPVDEASPIVDELKATKKRLEEAESDLKFVRYEKSSEFQEKYEKPYKAAWGKAIQDLDELTIQTEDGGVRKATNQDMITLANLPLGEARSMARNLFGDAADDVMAHRRVIKELWEAQTKALHDAKSNASEHEKKLATQRQVEHQEASRLWKETNNALAQKYPKWFAPVEGDAEGNELLRKGFSLADLHFIGSKHLTPEQVEALPERFRNAIKTKGELQIQDQVFLDALLRNKIASHGRIAANLKKANARIKELEESLKAYERSEPPAGRGGEGGGKVGGISNPLDGANAELEAIDLQNS